jgi:hypothetical protein
VLVLTVRIDENLIDQLVDPVTHAPDRIRNPGGRPAMAPRLVRPPERR